MRDRNKNETEGTGTMDQIKYFFKYNSGKILFGIGLVTFFSVAYTLAMNFKALS